MRTMKQKWMKSQAMREKPSALLNLIIEALRRKYGNASPQRKNVEVAIDLTNQRMHNIAC